MTPRLLIAIPVLVLLLFGAKNGETQISQSRCADCHFANPGDWGWHLTQWDHSGHGRSGVGCEKCHGGDPTTFESFRAHQGMLGRQNPASPIHRSNLPQTCGACHAAPFAAFQKSRHYELLREGNRDTPTCVTCHGEVGAYLLSPKALHSQCSSCHGAGKFAERTDLPAEGKMLLSSVREVREMLDQARRLIGRVKEGDRRANLNAELAEALAPLTEAVDVAHMFVFDQMQEKVAEARRRAELLLEELANPGQGE